MTEAERIAIDKARALSSWYQRSIRNFLEEHAGDQLAHLDGEVERLNSAVVQDRDTVVCFVGPSAIGKSTLLNALVAGEKTIAPSGGVGPLTALATEVRYSPIPKLTAEYHPKKHLWRVASALNFQVARERKEHGSTSGDPHELSLSEADREEVAEHISQTADAENEGASRRMEEAIRTARLMVAGNQHEHRDTAYLADALSVACGVKPRWGSQVSAEDQQRVERIQRALRSAEKGERLTLEQAADPKAFREALREHAAGFLSPLIRRIQVEWPSDLLKHGLVLVDLPGVGVAGDVYKAETQRYVRERARAVVLVMDRAGPTESVMELLRTTGYWDRLVLSSDDPSSDPCSLLLAVTRVDDVATQDWYDIDPDEEGRRPKSKAQVFMEVAEKLLRGMKRMFEEQLRSFTHTEHSEVIREGRAIAGRNLLETVKIHPVSAIEYRRIFASNEDDRPFLSDPEQAGVPSLARSLTALAASAHDRRMERLSSLSSRVAESISNQLRVIEAAWKADRVAEEAERIRRALDVVLADRRKMLDQRRESFRLYLESVVTERIRTAVLEAKDEARRDVNKYLRSLRDANWATLKAAVRRGGTFHGARHIDLPSDIALRFQDPVAAVWSQQLLKEIRKATYDLAGDMRDMVTDLCEWVVREHGAYVDQAVIASQRKLVSAQVESLRDVGKEAVSELRDVVKVQIVQTIEQPIRAACKRFVDSNEHIGRGVKQRILTLFEELADSATDAARRPTETTLLSHYRSVKKDITSAFNDWGDPLESAADAIVARHEKRVSRSDSQRRTRVLNTIHKLLEESSTLIGDEPRH